MSETGWSGPMPDDPDLGIFRVCFNLFCYPSGWSEVTPDDLELTENTHNGHLWGWGYKYPFNPPLLLFSSLPAKPAPKAFILPLSSIQKLESYKDSLRDWEKVRFGSWCVRISWASTCSSQEVLETTFDSSIRVLYSWSFAPRRLEVPVSSHFFVVESLEVCISPPLRENISKWLNPPTWLIGRGKRVIGQPCSLWAPQRRRSSFVEWTSG